MIKVEISDNENIDFWKDISENMKYEIVSNQIKLLNTALTQLFEKNKHFYFVTYTLPIIKENPTYLEEAKTALNNANKEFNKIKRKYDFSYVSTYGTRNESGEFFLHRHLLIITSGYMSEGFKNSLRNLDLSVHIKNIRNDKNLHENLTNIIEYQTKNYIEALSDRDILKLVGIKKIYVSSRKILSKNIEEIHKLYYIKSSLDAIKERLKNGDEVKDVMNIVPGSRIRSIRLYPKLSKDYYDNRINKLYMLLSRYDLNHLKLLLRNSINQIINEINESYGPFYYNTNHNRKYTIFFDDKDRLVFLDIYD